MAVPHLLSAAPFSFAQTPGRLPKNVVPEAYEIFIEPKIEEARVTGHESVFLDIREETREITLNAASLEITKATLRRGDGEEQLLQFELSDATQLLKLTAPSALAPGKYVLFLRWRGALNEQPEGLFITRYTTAHGEKRALATQMEAADARRMFPCWDEPVFRATFALTAVVPEHFTAISNMPLASEIALGEGRKELRFAPTPSMSSYLVAFAAGELESIADELDGVQLRVFTTEGKKEQGRFALEATKNILTYYRNYFGLPYPLPKLDQFCFPGFAAGGMENWGAIFYNDTTLLVEAGTPSLANRERVFEVVAHEIAHQWFGNLVTMAWWDDLWLNEGFASWMGTKATDHFHPEWNVWVRAAGAKEWAMALDARRTTHPIQQPVANEAQASDAFDEITYQKGQAFLRMLEEFLGEEKFRAGIRSYFAAHAFSNATTADLWRALDQASEKPVTEIAKGWTEQPGFPLIHAAGARDSERQRISFWQERFTIAQTDPTPLTWQIPLAVTFRPIPERRKSEPVPQEQAPLLLGPQPAEITSPLSPFKVNPGGIGYFRVAYDDQAFAGLARFAPQMAEADRLNFLADTWALVQAERLPAARLLDLIATLAPQEKSYAVWEQIGWALDFTDALLRDSELRPRFRAWACALWLPQLARLGWEPRPGESELDGALRGDVIGYLGAWEEPSVVAKGTQLFADFIKDHAALAGDLRRPVLNLMGRHADAKTYATLHQMARDETSTELKRQLYHALAGNRDAARATETLALALTPELLPNDAAYLVNRVAGGGEHPELAWEFAKTHAGALLAKLASIRANDYLPGIARSFSETKFADELERYAKEKLPAEAKPSVEKAADEIRFKAALKKRLLPEVAAWLEAH